jgi:hypothetical protein
LRQSGPKSRPSHTCEFHRQRFEGGPRRHPRQNKRRVCTGGARQAAFARRLCVEAQHSSRVYFREHDAASIAVKSAERDFHSLNLPLWLSMKGTIATNASGFDTILTVSNESQRSQQQVCTPHLAVPFVDSDTVFIVCGNVRVKYMPKIGVYYGGSCVACHHPNLNVRSASTIRGQSRRCIGFRCVGIDVQG